VDTLILGFLNQSKTPGNCGVELANLHSGESAHNMPKSNPENIMILLCICSFNPQLTVNLPNDRSSFQSYCWQVPKLTWPTKSKSTVLSSLSTDKLSKTKQTDKLRR
jgi:hypothetical protein